MPQDYERRKQEYLEELQRREQAHLEEMRQKEELERQREEERRRQQEEALRLARRYGRGEEGGGLLRQLFKTGGRGAVGGGTAAGAGAGAGAAAAGGAAAGAGAAGAAGAGAAAGGAAAATSPIWGTIGVIILIILLILFVVFVALTTLIVLCNAEGWTGTLARWGSSAAALVGVVDQDYCKAFKGMSGVAEFVMGKAQIPPPGGEFCAANIQPPPGYNLDCANCIDLRTKGVPVKPPPPPGGSTNGANPFADPRIADRLAKLVAVNNTFIVTEAFCPVVNHADHDHYNGLDVDINLQDQYKGDNAKLADLYRDAQSLGFSVVLCEYPAGTLDEYGISCGAQETTTGGHIHLEEAHTEPK